MSVMGTMDKPNLTKITKRRNESVARIMKLVEEADFDQVMVIGFNGPNFQIMASETLSRMQQVGALEFIKHDIVHNDD